MVQVQRKHETITRSESYHLNTGSGGTFPGR